jgi:AAA domain
MTDDAGAGPKANGHDHAADDDDYDPTEDMPFGGFNLDAAGRPSEVEFPRCTTASSWSSLRLPQMHFLLGELFSRTSRGLLIGQSGVGKTNFAMAVGLSMSQGLDFLHWRAGRPADVLYFDGEMSPRLAKSRIADAVRRIGHLERPDHFHLVSLNQLPWRPDPLNTRSGQKWLEKVINQVTPDFAIFDNIQSLLSGPMNEEQSWTDTLPLIHELTRNHIGQLWCHHTGWDQTHGYGTSTREWQIDTVMRMKPIDSASDHVHFELEFTKARERAPDNRADFASKIIELKDDEWTATDIVNDAKPAARGRQRDKQPSPTAQKYHDALLDALTQTGERRSDSAGLPSVNAEQWHAEIRRRGLLKDGDDTDAQHSNRSRISKYRAELIAAEWVVVNGEYAWTIRQGAA